MDPSKSMLDISEQMMQANTPFVDAAMKIGAEAMRSHGHLVQQQISLLEKFAEAAKKHMTLMTDLRSPADYFAKAGELSTDLGHDIATIMRESMEVQFEAGQSFVSAWRDELLRGFDPARSND